MSAANKGAPAFPEVRRVEGKKLQRVSGMTLRDYFAAKAITGTCPGGAIQDGEIARYASWAYRMADAMLAERAK